MLTSAVCYSGTYPSVLLIPTIFSLRLRRSPGPSLQACSSRMLQKHEDFARLVLRSSNIPIWMLFTSPVQHWYLDLPAEKCLCRETFTFRDTAESSMYTCLVEGHVERTIGTNQMVRLFLTSPHPQAMFLKQKKTSA